jgi:hypothetical protein
VSEGRDLLQEGPEEITLSSGVTVVVSPFPTGMHNNLQAKLLDEHPDPKPPKKTIEVVDGTEEVDDLNDPNYLQELAKARRKRNDIFAEAVIEFSVRVKDMDEWADTVQRLESYLGKRPKNLSECQLWFLSNYGFRTKADYQRVVTSALSQALIEDKEVARRLETFQGDVARSTDNGAGPPGTDDDERVEVQPEADGTEGG